ncbi:MAG: hypothetical protein IJ762_08835 [Bacteroidaceae bacterium]|jgi:hypothetical protein|nr:hypothetical protein [Bacteroidaceae bacterium]MBR1789274.1 hypothetical protein [Bacteroidaceae bacterium]
MKRTVSCLIGLMVLLFSIPAQAQTTIADIRKAYQEQKQIIARMSDDFPAEGIPPVYYHLHVSQNLPATGMHHENVYMYYGELPSEEEFDPYPPHYLSFVTSKYNFAAREFYEEFLYDEQGQVAFIYARTPDFDFPKMHEFRLYFDGQHLLRLNVKESQKQDSFEDIYTGTTIPEEYKEFCSQYTNRAFHFLEIFKTIEAGSCK